MQDLDDEILKAIHKSAEENVATRVRELEDAVSHLMATVKAQELRIRQLECVPNRVRSGSEMGHTLPHPEDGFTLIHSGGEVTDEGAPYHKMLDNSNDLMSLWREWVVGTPDRPAVEQMDKAYGKMKWIKGEAGRKTYYRRKTIIDAIKNSPLYDEKDPSAALSKADEVKGGPFVSLYKFSLMIKNAGDTPLF